MPLAIYEQVVVNRVSLERNESHSALSDLIIDDSTCHFEKREFSPDISIVLPIGMCSLAADMLVFKYPNANRPEIILSSTDASVSFSFECMSATTRDIDLRLAEYKAVIKRMHPGYVFFTEEIFNLESGVKGACYDFRGIALDGDIYCLNFFIDLPNAELLGWFSCSIDQQERWESLFMQMVKTITPLKHDKE